MVYNYVTVIGLIAATLTTLAFLPQVLKVWRLRETRDLSLTTFMMFTLGVLMWLIYGILQNDIAVLLANAATLILASIILGFKFKYG